MMDGAECQAQTLPELKNLSLGPRATKNLVCQGEGFWRSYYWTEKEAKTYVISR